MQLVASKGFGDHILDMNESGNNPTNLPAVQEKKFQRDSRKVEKGFWLKLRRLASHLPFTDTLLAAYFAATDSKTPLHVKAVLMGSLAYFVTPVDMIPDFIALLGYSDDATVLFAAIRTVASNITPEHRDRAKAALEDLHQNSPSSEVK